jgi:ABC-type sugar transport system substrate-binding protein
MVHAKSLLVAVASCAVLSATASASAFEKVKRNDERVLVSYPTNTNFCNEWNQAWYGGKLLSIHCVFILF